jgi:hypothetical protein
MFSIGSRHFLFCTVTCFLIRHSFVQYLSSGCIAPAGYHPELATIPTPASGSIIPAAGPREGGVPCTAAQRTEHPMYKYIDRGEINQGNNIPSPWNLLMSYLKENIVKDHYESRMKIQTGKFRKNRRIWLKKYIELTLIVPFLPHCFIF